MQNLNLIVVNWYKYMDGCVMDKLITLQINYLSRHRIQNGFFLLWDTR